MAKRKKKSKEEVIEEIFDNKVVKRNNSYLNYPVNKSVNYTNNSSMRPDNIFVTNLSMVKLNGAKN